ncbi:MAG: putative 2-dehydropantoate 2-reductase [Chloroflexi bacterium]|nr:putative 2-dehydropantoate 2-reductase [Chloroflexota bacterium]
MKVAIIGVGAVGGYYGGLLARSGLDVHFLLRSDYPHVREHGLVVESVNGDFALPQVNAYARPEDMPRCDVAFVALKTTKSAALAGILPHVLKPDGVLVVLQNGLGVEEDAARLMPEATVLGGLCFVCSHKVGPGHIRHLDYGLVTLGQYAPGYEPCGITPGLRAVARMLEDAGAPVALAEDLGKARWQKLIWNVPFNGLTVVLDATTRQLMDCPASRRLAREVMLEVIAGAKACGYTLDEGSVEEMLGRTERMVAYKPSMKLDHERGEPLEIETLYWRPVRAAEAAGYQMVAVRTLALQLEYCQGRRATSG